MGPSDEIVLLTKKETLRQSGTLKKNPYMVRNVGKRAKLRFNRLASRITPLTSTQPVESHNKIQFYFNDDLDSSTLPTNNITFLNRKMINEYMCSNYVAKQILYEVAPHHIASERRSMDESKGNNGLYVDHSSH